MMKCYRLGTLKNNNWANKMALFALFFILISIPSQAVPMGGKVPDDEEYTALMEFFESTYGGKWDHNDNWGKGTSAGDFAKWYGVTVVDDDVVGIDLDYNNLSGNFNDSFVFLSGLRHLSVGQNHISGKLPDFERIPLLEYINVSENELSGDTPSSIGGLAELRNISLSHNRFTGPILQQLQGCVKLEEFYINDNLFAGSVPVFYQGVWPNLLIFLCYKQCANRASAGNTACTGRGMFTAANGNTVRRQSAEWYDSGWLPNIPELGRPGCKQ